MAKRIPQFKGKTFRTPEEYTDFVLSNRKHSIYLKDNGQDLKLLCIHASGEVIYCDHHSRIYKGMFVNMESIKVGLALQFWNESNGKFMAYNKLIIESVTD